MRFRTQSDTDRRNSSIVPGYASNSFFRVYRKFKTKSADGSKAI